MIAHGKPKNDKLKITITKYQHELILEHVSLYIIDSDIEDVISNASVDKVPKDITQKRGCASTPNKTRKKQFNIKKL